MQPLLLCFVLAAAPPYARLDSGNAIAAQSDDEMPPGDDEMPPGDDDMPPGDDEMPGADDPAPADDEAMPPGDGWEAVSPGIVSVPPPRQCSMPPRAEGYIQLHLDRARSIDLHGLDAKVVAIEGDQGCIAEVEIGIELGRGCGLQMRFEQGGSGHYDLVSFRFLAKNCAELAGIAPGRYLLHAGSADLTLSGSPEADCLPQGLLRIAGRLVIKMGRHEIDVDLDGIRIRGDLKTAVDEGLQCRTQRRAAPLRLSSDTRPSKRGIWPWVGGGLGTAALVGGATWAWLYWSDPPGSLTIQLR